jgi:hypothetical protein
LIERLVAGNQVLATKWAAFSFAHLVQRCIRPSARLRLRKRINHLQWGGVVTKQLFCLAPHRIAFSFAHLVQRCIRPSARLRLRKRINHLQWGGVVTKQLFCLAPHRIGGF